MCSTTFLPTRKLNSLIQQQQRLEKEESTLRLRCDNLDLGGADLIHWSWIVEVISLLCGVKNWLDYGTNINWNASVGPLVDISLSWQPLSFLFCFVFVPHNFTTHALPHVFFPWSFLHSYHTTPIILFLTFPCSLLQQLRPVLQWHYYYYTRAYSPSHIMATQSFA